MEPLEKSGGVFEAVQACQEHAHKEFDDRNELCESVGDDSTDREDELSERLEAIMALKSLAHAQDASSREKDLQLEERLEAIVALKELVFSQKEKMLKLRTKYKELKLKYKRKRFSEGLFLPGVVTEDEMNGKRYTVSFGPSFEKTDADVFAGVIDYHSEDDEELSDLGAVYRSAAEEICKQATQMEVAIAIDELERVKDELQQSERKRQSCSEELASAKQELKRESKRLSLVEQERDLIQAESTKFKEDLQSCVAFLSSLGISDLGSPHAISPQSTYVSESSCELDEDKDDEEESALEDSYESHTMHEHRIFLETHSIPTLVSPRQSDPHREFSEQRSQSPTRKHDNNFSPSRIRSSFPSWRPSSLMKRNSVTSQQRDDAKRKKSRRRLFRRKKASDSPTLSMSSKSDSQHEVSKRVVTVRRYYEGVVSSLQHNIVDLKTEKSRLENQLHHELSSLDIKNRNAIESLRKELREKDDMIEELQMGQVGDYDRHSIRRKEAYSPPRFC